MIHHEAIASNVQSLIQFQEKRCKRTKARFCRLGVVKTYPVRVSRGLPVSQEVLERYGVRSSIDEQTGEVNAIYYPYHDQDKNVVGYKVRRIPKTFP